MSRAREDDIAEALRARLRAIGDAAMVSGDDETLGVCVLALALPGIEARVVRQLVAAARLGAR